MFIKFLFLACSTVSMIAVIGPNWCCLFSLFSRYLPSIYYTLYCHLYVFLAPAYDDVVTSCVLTFFSKHIQE
jgi:hypothetical protein